MNFAHFVYIDYQSKLETILLFIRNVVHICCLLLWF